MASSLHSLFSDPKEMMLPSGIVSRNELLKQLLEVPDVATSLLSELRIVTLTPNQVLYEQGDNIGVVYFPLDCVISGLAIMEDGTTMETSMVGRDCMVGISSLLGSGLSRQWIWVTIGGTAIHLETRLLEKLFFQNEVVLKAFLKCYRSVITQVSQRCVCNTRHTIMERLCCWLLMVHDRIGDLNLNLTQEMIASRVGARRAGITVAAGMLQEMNAIEYRRGRLHIRDRALLERVVCECYAILKADGHQPPRFIPPARYK
ncbi:MAG TPA: Crp/Fnr family transcriptional regulator [Pyrinomonadaceae bacterium]|nr:Crp/Fnr family transcriptional regulator [Pyrinomonadaceae bacterium]